MARFTSGWIKAWRKAAESDLVDNLIVWGLWHWLLYAATWQPQKKIIDGKQRLLPPGTVLFSPKEVATLWGCSESAVRKWLNYLHDTGRVVRESCGRGTLVTICNWDAYQGSQDQACAEREDAVRTACVPRADAECLNEEVKKGRKKEEESIGVPAIADSRPAVSDKNLAKAEQAQKANQFVGAYVKAYQTRFPDSRPEDLNDGKVRGQICAWVKDYPLERACQLIQVYFQMEAKWFGTKGYDFLTFRNNLNKIGQALDSGKDPDGHTVDWAKVFGDSV